MARRTTRRGTRTGGSTSLANATGLSNVEKLRYAMCMNAVLTPYGAWLQALKQATGIKKLTIAEAKEFYEWLANRLFGPDIILPGGLGFSNFTGDEPDEYCQPDDDDS